jgi:hypothetical protein
MARLVEKVSVGVLLVFALSSLVFPAELAFLLDPGIAALVDAVTWASVTLPQPVFLGVIFLVTATVTILIGLSTARVLYAISRRAGPRTRWAFDKVTPSTPIGKAAFAFGFTICFLIGSVWALPYVIGDLSDSSGVANTSDVVAGNGTGDILSETEREALRILSADASVDQHDEYRGAEYERPTPDTDGDRLKDSWERAGETPDGVQLPDANPQRMDLYVQINYGSGTTPLSATEKRQLREVWASMPVDNPDGSQGITLHIDDQRPQGGLIDGDTTYAGTGDDEITRFYTPQFLGERSCRYHQVVVGQLQGETLAGRASAPGYAAYVDTERNENYVELTEKADFDREVSPRVHVVTHELLHNVVGEVDGSLHTNEGWLTPSAHPRDAFLSDATASEISANGLAGSGYYQHEVCGSG